MPITFLSLGGDSKVTDLTLLKDLPSSDADFAAKDIKTGWEAIRQHPTLKMIEPTGVAYWEAAQPVAEFWKRFDAGEFTNAVRPVLPARPPASK